MGEITPFRRTRKQTGRRPASPTGRPQRRRREDIASRTTDGKQERWFPIALVALPLAAFTAVLLLPVTGGPPKAEAATEAQPLFAAAPSSSTDREQARFPICGGGWRVTCVVDGDTIWLRGEKIRIADIDTPEVSNPACAREAQLGEQATLRMQALLNEGAFTLELNPDGRDADDYGRKLRVVSRGGESLGETLVREGLAERWGGPRVDWC